MSMKNYDAYIFNNDINNLMPFLINIRKYHLKKFSLILKQFKNFTFFTKDYNFLDDDTQLKNLKPHQLALILTHIMNQQYNTPLNMQAHAVVFFHNKRIIIKFFGISNDYLSNYSDFLIDYHYQNQSDLSNYDFKYENWNDMSDKRKSQLLSDWNERKNTRNDLIPNYSTFSENGLSYDFYPSDYLLDIFCDDVLSDINNIEN